ncbi:MAG: hypothetical protein IJA59_00800 [Clostridia bacterium]|nr:hypothetical protein [Clostridia bacterium]
MAENLLRKVDVDWLLTIYGAMLTDKQQEIATLYFEEDLSLAEIAQQEGVSRQSVHDTLQRVEKQLRTWEDKLGMRARLTHVQSCLETALVDLDQDTAAARKSIEKALSLLTDEED